nr:ATP-binding cassette domain-containing protein [Providencia rettgeri]
MLEFKKVSTHYGKIQALHEISLNIQKGEIVTLIGANGAGKTTLLSTLCGDPRASEGQVIYRGVDITQLPTSKIMREDIALVPEGRRVFSRMTVEENLAMGAFLLIANSTKNVLSGFISCFQGYMSAEANVQERCQVVSNKC